MRTYAVRGSGWKSRLCEMVRRDIQGAILATTSSSSCGLTPCHSSTPIHFPSLPRKHSGRSEKGQGKIFPSLLPLPRLTSERVASRANTMNMGDDKKKSQVRNGGRRRRSKDLGSCVLSLVTNAAWLTRNFSRKGIS